MNRLWRLHPLFKLLRHPANHLKGLIALVAVLVLLIRVHQGKIERYHRTMKNIIKLEHYYSPGELEAHIAEFVDYYNNQRYH